MVTRKRKLARAHKPKERTLHCVLPGDDRGLTGSEEAGVLRLCSGVPLAHSDSGALAGLDEQFDPSSTRSATQLFKMNLGPACLLGSHCIVLVHHYLDTLVHCCPGKLWEGAGEAVAKVSKQRQRRSKRRKNQQRDEKPENVTTDEGPTEGQAAECTLCGLRFNSRNQLFKHINSSSSRCRRQEGNTSQVETSACVADTLDSDTVVGD